MIEIKNVWVGGFEGALRGMRMPFESQAKSDTVYNEDCIGYNEDEDSMEYSRSIRRFGEADMALCKKLIKAGPEHRKFLRMIHVQFDIRMPRYVATELDTYKIGTTKNSSSTMHLITKRELTIDDFSIDYNPETCIPYEILRNHVQDLIEAINDYKRDKEEGCDEYILESDFRIIKQILPESFMQMATYDMTYETLLNIHHQRHAHRLSEWQTFCAWIEGLPYMSTFIEALDKN